MLLPFFEWCESTRIASTIQGSIWLFPVIEAVHLLGLCLLGGSILLVDLRLMGIGLTRQTVSRLSYQARPWMMVAVITMIATGLPLFLSEAIKCYYNQAFWVKITTLPFALSFTFLIRDRIARADRAGMYIRAITGASSVALWFLVAAAGRWIGFS